MCSESWVTKIGDVEDLERGEWLFWLEAIVPEDRLHVEKVLFSPQLPDEHSLYYRLATMDGTVLAVEHRVMVRQRGVSGNPVSLAGILVEDRGMRSAADKINLQSVAIEHNFLCPADSELSIPGRNELTRVLELLKECSELEAPGSPITLSPGGELNHCSVCGEDPGLESMKLVLHGQKINRADLLDLPGRDYSLQHLGESAGWGALCQVAHKNGFHLQLSLNDAHEMQLHLAGGSNAARDPF